MKTPFHNKEGKLVFPYQPIRDIVFVWPCPPPEKVGKESLLYLPEDHRKTFHDGTGVLLSIGSGYKDNKGKWYTPSPKLTPGTRVAFDINAPWGEYFLGQDKKMHYVVICGVEDVNAVVVG